MPRLSGRTAAELHTAAVDLTNRGRYAAARRLLAVAGRRADEPDVAARIAGSLAVILARTGDAEVARALADRARSDPRLSAATRGILAGQLGFIAHHQGHLEDADRWYGLGIADVDDEVASARMLVTRGFISLQRGRLDDASRDTAAAAVIHLAHERQVEAAQARHNLGYIQLLRGELVAALGEMAAARDVLVDVSDVTVAIVDADRAEALREAGATRDAERLLTQAAAVFGARRMEVSRADAELQLARSLLGHDPARARRVAGAAERRFRRQGNESAAARAAGIRVRADLRGAVVDPMGRRSAAIGAPAGHAEVAAAAARLDRSGRHDEATAVRIAERLADAARGRRGGRMPRVAPTAPIEVRLLAAEARSARATAAGRHARARAEAAQGLDALARWQDAFGSLDLQTSLAIHGAGLVYAGLASAVRSGRPAEAFEWSERARHLSQRVLPLRPPPDPDLAADLAAMRVMRFEDSDWLSRADGIQLRERTRDRQWSATGAASQEDRIDLDGLRERLGADTALLAFVSTGGAMAALVVTGEAEALLPIVDWPGASAQLRGLRADLDMAAAVRAGSLAAVVRRSLGGRLHHLSATLLDAALAVVGDRRIVLTAPGELAGLPWGMLPGLHRRVFTLATSATRWAHQQRDLAPPASAGFVVGPRVARGREEVEAAAAAWLDPVVLDDGSATVGATSALAERVDVLHVAAHGRHAVDNPLFSGLELADGALFGYDVDLVPRVPGMVVLSSCEVGRSSVRGGEEAIGMTRIWLHAGTRAVIATPVVVADDDACELLAAMHTGLAAGRTPSVALAEASARTGIVSSFQVHGNGF